MLHTFALILALVAGQPSGMADDAWRQLQTAEDESPRLDEGALYPLLRMSLDAGSDEAGARVPDYRAMLESPAEYRGEKFLIEGRFAGRPREIGLARPGPWGDAITEWGVVLDDDEAGPAPEPGVVMIYIVDPDNEIGAPRIRQRLRLTARFYKVWETLDLNNQPTRYLTFIARPEPGVLSQEQSGPGDGGGGGQSAAVITVALTLVGGGLLIWRYLRQRAQPTPTQSQQRWAERRQRERDGAAAGDASEELAEDEADPLPEDPAAAMEQMQRRHENQH